VADFYLDKYEITVGRFRQFVNAGMGTQSGPPASGAGVHPLITGSGWDSGWNASLPTDTVALKAAMNCKPSYQTWTDTAGDNESRPQNCMDWYTAFAFCAWDGGRLATEAEWNYAAAGGSEQREYPWGTDINSTKASYGCMGDGDYSTCALTDFIVVGTKPEGNGLWGHADLAGNVWEWTLDWYSTYQLPCNNCANRLAANATYGRVFRGGYFYGSSDNLRSSYRTFFPPESHSHTIGSRCARAGL
jgi:formylglycine-generating enzyme required for sulfatase activity